MSQRSKQVTSAFRWLLAAAFLAATGPGATAQVMPVVEPPFDDHYTLVDLGDVDGVHVPYGGLTFVPGDPDAILLTGYTGAEIATLFAVALARDATGSITSFAGTAVPAVAAYGASGGLAYGPGGVLFYTRVTIEMGEVKPGSAITDKVVNLRSLSWNPGGLNFVPPGLGGAGTLKLVTFAYGEWWSLGLTPDANGTYDVTGATKGPSLQGHPAGFAYVAPDTPGFLDPGLLVCEHENAYDIGKIAMYDVDEHGDPVVATRRVVVSGLDVPQSIAVDPLTGDVLFVSYQGYLYLLRSAPFPPTTTTTLATTTTTSTSTSTSSSTSMSTSSTTSSTKAPTTTTSSTTTLPTTSTTVPTTTSTTVRPTTTTSTTAHPSTTTTSTTVRPTTTSSSSTSSTTSSQPPASSSTTTTLPAPCGVEPSFEWIGCSVDALLALVRGSSDLGSLQPTFVARLEQAQATLAEGAASCAGGERAIARRALERLGRQMLLVRARTRTLRARKTIPRPLAERIGDEARGIAADARALRASLECA